MCDSIEEFLERAGGIEILCEIDRDGTRYTEFEEAIPVGHDALSDRLKAGVKLDLLEEEVVTGQPGSSHKYVLAPKGARLQQILERQGAIEAYRFWRDSTHWFDNKKKEFKTWVEDNPEELEKDEWNRMVEFTRRYVTSETDETPYEPSPFVRFFREYGGPWDDESEE